MKAIWFMVLAVLISGNVTAQEVEKVDENTVKRIEIKETVFVVDDLATKCASSDEQIEFLQAQIDRFETQRTRCLADVDEVKEFLKSGRSVNWQDIEVLR